MCGVCGVMWCMWYGVCSVVCVVWCVWYGSVMKVHIVRIVKYNFRNNINTSDTLQALLASNFEVIKVIILKFYKLENQIKKKPSS